MSKKTEYIYNKNGNIPFTDKDKNKLITNDDNLELMIVNDKEYKVLKNKNALVNINHLSDKLKETFKREFNNADYIGLSDIKKRINELIKEIEDLKIEQEKLQEQINKYDIDTPNTNNIVKSTTKLPPSINIDFDIMKLFNNIYPNYQFKSIDDDRHKDIDIKAELMLDLNVNDVSDMEDLRLINFLKSGKIQLFPIQSALINGFISIRDFNNDADKTIPLLSTLKYITENKSMRLPTSKKDLSLYEDFMLFFNKCKIQIKIINRNTKEVYFEILKPIPLLANTPTFKEGKYGYIIGNSVLNILKNELDNLYNTPRQTTHLITKQYLNSKLPNTPPMINITQYVYSKIATMINTYQKKSTYQPKINIECLYDFQALYKKHPKADKQDKQDTREMLNKYLDHLINTELIVSYTPIQKGREINIYKIEINKKAKI